MALTAVQLAREVERIIAKRRRGEQLTLKEERTLAYGGGGSCPSCYKTFRVNR